MPQGHPLRSSWPSDFSVARSKLCRMPFTFSYDFLFIAYVCLSICCHVVVLLFSFSRMPFTFGTARGGEGVLLTEILLPRIARLASNCSTGNCLSNFNKGISSKGSNCQNEMTNLSRMPFTFGKGSTPNLPKIIPTKIRCPEIPRKLLTDMRIPPLNIKSMLESNLLKSIINLSTEIDRTAIFVVKTFAFTISGSRFKQ